ncbi:hypothetical protein [Duganella levis]|uniref:Uncharacterized protein n=1 Tax=Duganella levis TaxID=2692169 RepID=A0ABW9W4V7_9BURK|nr:hypothetical protein [Duganella levis]MYN28915.1 hypothetical protein [Duganella levis]
MGILIPAKRLYYLPKEVRLAHEYCFFVHDEFVRMLAEYEAAEAHIVSFEFENKAQSKRFTTLAKNRDAVTALRELGLHHQARRVVLNTITMAMVADCGHHIYESLRCFEKRKIVPAFNLLRKPLIDNLMYLSWMVADEDGFYNAFSSGDPTKITQKIMGNRRKEILAKAISETELVDVVTADEIHSIVFEPSNSYGLYGFFQHAVHLVTTDRIEIRTSPENFNFIFKDPADDDVYSLLYTSLPTMLLYMAHLILALYERIKPMDQGGKKAFVFRSIHGHGLLKSESYFDALAKGMSNALGTRIKCPTCHTPLKSTRHNAARLLLSESFRCTRCRRVQPFPFSWII